MIYHVEGDILLSKAQTLAHGVAPGDPMDQGLALSLHKNYPSMHKDFHHWCHQTNPKPGEAWMWGGADNVRIVNLLTQDGGHGHGAKPGKATLTNINHALRTLKKIVSKEKLASIALPRLATGVGGLKWGDVLPVIEKQLGDLDIPVYLYSVFHPGQQANEPGM